MQRYLPLTAGFYGLRNLVLARFGSALSATWASTFYQQTRPQLTSWDTIINGGVKATLWVLKQQESANSRPTNTI